MECIAAILELIGKWIVGHKHRYGWIIAIVARLCWIISICIIGQSYVYLLFAIPMILIDIRNYRKWGKNGKDSATKV